MKCLLATPFALLLAGCVSTPILASKTPCTSLIPAEWREGVPNAPLPPETDDELERLKGWVNFGVDQTGRLSKANGRTVDAIGIIERCSARDMEAIEAAKPKFLGIF